MTQIKKTASAAKLASSAANKAAKTTYEAVSSTRNSAENVVKIGSRAAQDFIKTSAEEAEKAQSKIIAMSRDGIEQFTKSADAVTKALHEAIGSSRNNVEAAVECGNVASSLAKELSSEIFEYANRNFADGVELSREMFSCRTINEVMELQNRALRSVMDNSFSQIARISSLLFEYSSEALEPINERVAQVSEELSKTIKACS